MRKIGEILRLKAAGMSIRDIAQSTGAGRTTVFEYLARAEAAGIGVAAHRAQVDEPGVPHASHPRPAHRAA